MFDKKKKLLVADDQQFTCMIINELFSEKFDVIEAENGKVALQMIEEYGAEIAILLLDIMMPVMGGFEVLEHMHKSGIIQTIPVILITSEGDEEKTLLGYELGVSDLVNKPLNPDIIYRRVNNVVDLYSHKHELEIKLQQQKEEIENQNKRLKQANQSLIDALSTTVEFRNFESGTHIQRIRILTRFLLSELSSDLNLTPEQVETMANASAVHDIGKIAIPDAILLKPGPLTAEEFEIMKTHTTSGCEILQRLDQMQDREYYVYCYEICRHHHERWDGRGYPDRLKGDEIPIWAQATSLADVYDALTSKRVYKDAFTHNEAFDMIVRGECGVFNPLMIDHFINIKDKLYEEFYSPNSPLVQH